MKFLLAPSLVFCLSTTALADFDFHRGRPENHGNERSERNFRNDFDPRQISYNGNGCPAGTASISLSPDNLTFSILFDKFLAEVTSSSLRPMDRKTCQVAIPITVPENMRVGITSVDYRGFSDVPVNGRGTLLADFNFRGLGRVGPQGMDRGNGEVRSGRIRYDFLGPKREDYTLSSGVMSQRQYSSCGEKFVLLLNTEVSLLTPAVNQAGSITLDSMDGNSHLEYHLIWERCNPDNNGQGDRGAPRGPDHGDGSNDRNGRDGRGGRPIPTPPHSPGRR